MGGEDYTPLAPNPKQQNPPDYGKKPQKPNFGHIHVYLSPYGAVKPIKFVMVDKLQEGNRGSFTIKDLPPGRYRLLVELVNYDHSPRLKDHSNDFPPMDMTSVTTVE